MTTPASNVDTTSGGGGDFDGGANDPAYRAPGSGVPDTDGNAPDTTDNIADSGGRLGGAGRTGDTDPHTKDPQAIGDTTTPGGGFPAYRTGDTDSHARDPQQLQDTTQIGGGAGASSTGQAYRAPSDAPPASNQDTTQRSGYLAVNPGSPDAAVVGSAGGLNPNAVEPGFTNSANTGSNRDTTNAGAPSFSPVPAQEGTPAAPTGVTAVAIANRAAANVSWTAPANAVATGVVGYIITSNTGGETEVGKNATTVEFDQGLIPGDTYTFTVFARTSNGTGPRSAPSAPLTMPFDANLTADTTRAEGL